MAVRTQKPQIDEPIVVGDPVDLIELEHERAIAPLRDATRRTLIAPAFREKPAYDSWPSIHERGPFGEEDVVRLALLAGYGFMAETSLAARPATIAQVSSINSELANALPELAMRAALGGKAELCEHTCDRHRLGHQPCEQLGGDRSAARAQRLSSKMRRVESCLPDPRGDHPVVAAGRSQAEPAEDLCHRVRGLDDRSERAGIVVRRAHVARYPATLTVGRCANR